MRPTTARFRLLAPIVVALVALAACSSDDPPEDTSNEIANPASAYCVDQGGQVEMSEGPDGEAGVCVLPDGTRVDEWEYFRSNAPSPTGS